MSRCSENSPLLSEGKIKPHEQVVIFNTGSGIKYLDYYGS